VIHLEPGNYGRLKRLAICHTIHPRLTQLKTALGLRTVNSAAILPMTPMFDRNELTNLSTLVV
jgi:hypothetical protein